MWVTVWRHGEAGMAPRDEDRSLTDKGKQTVESAAVEFQSTLIRAGDPLPTRSAFSPFERTRQTAAILAACWDINTRVCDALAPGTDIERPDTFLLRDVEHQVIVSHQPFVSQIIWHWLDDDRLDSLLPGGWATLELLAPIRGGGRLIRSRPNVFS